MLLVFIGIGAKAQHFDLESTNLKEGDTFNTKRTIRFELAKWKILPESYGFLDSLAVFLKRNKILLEIGVHTDARGSNKYCYRLDQKRAQAIADYLIAKDIPLKRLIAIGYGKSELLVADEVIAQMKSKLEKEEAHAKNRRVVFKVVKILP